MSLSIPMIQGVVEQGRALAESVMNCEIRIYERGNTTPILITKGRVKKPRPGVFDAMDTTEWQTKRRTVIQIPRDVDLSAHNGVIQKGWIIQVSGGNDPTVNNINYVVDSQVDSGYAYARNIAVSTEATATPRIQTPAP